MPHAADPLRHARDLMERGRSAQARDVLAQAIAEGLDGAPVRSLMGFILHQLGDLQGCERELHRRGDERVRQRDHRVSEHEGGGSPWADDLRLDIRPVHAEHHPRRHRQQDQRIERVSGQETPGQVIELQASDNLANWETLVRSPASAEGTFTHIEGPVQRPRRFYRVAP